MTLSPLPPDSTSPTLTGESRDPHTPRTVDSCQPMAFRTFHRSTYKNVCGSCRSSASLITLTDTLSYHANCSGSRRKLRSLFGMASGPRLRSPLSTGQDSWPSPGVHRLGYVGRWLSREHATADPDGQQGICSRSSTITAGNSSTTSSRLTARSRSSRASSAYVPTCFDGRELTIFSDEDAARLRPESDAQCLRQGPGQLLSGGENPQVSSVVYHRPPHRNPNAWTVRSPCSSARACSRHTALPTRSNARCSTPCSPAHICAT